MCVGLILILYNNGIYKGFKREKINKYVVIKLYIIVRTFMNNLKTLYYVNSTTIKKKNECRGRINSNNDHIILY